MEEYYNKDKEDAKYSKGTRILIDIFNDFAFLKECRLFYIDKYIFLFLTNEVKKYDVKIKTSESETITNKFHCGIC